jgi:hypothetical protein
MQLVLSFLLLLVVGALAAPDCQGKVGDFSYDLNALVQQLGSAELTTADPQNQVYYYKPCGKVSNELCQTATDTSPAVCQKDVSKPPQYHDLGSQTTATWSALPSAYGGQGDGFTLAFSGGGGGRASHIYFRWFASPHLNYVQLFKKN